MGTRHTAQIYEHPQGGKYSLKFVLLREGQETTLGYGKAASFQKLISSNEVVITKLFNKPITCNNDRVDTTKTPRPNKPFNLLYTFYLLCSHGSANCAHAYYGNQVNPWREFKQLWCVRENQGTSQREVAENQSKIFKYALQMWIARDTTKSGYITFDPGGMSIMNQGLT